MVRDQSSAPELKGTRCLLLLYGLGCMLEHSVLGHLSRKEILGGCKRLSSAGVQLTCPPDVNACRVRVPQSHHWAYPKPFPGDGVQAVPFQRCEAGSLGLVTAAAPAPTVKPEPCSQHQLYPWQCSRSHQPQGSGLQVPFKYKASDRNLTATNILMTALIKV